VLFTSGTASFRPYTTDYGKQVVVALVTILRKRAADVACCAAAGRVSSVDYRCV
jgi:hypothetical protein